MASPDPALDFLSPAFDAAAALAAPGLAPPVPGARPLDSIFRCRFMLPDGHPDAWREPARAAKTKVPARGRGRGVARWLERVAAQGRRAAPLPPSRGRHLPLPRRDGHSPLPAALSCRA